MSTGDVIMAIAGVALLAAAVAQWRRGQERGLGSSAPMTAGALVVGGVCLLVAALVG